MKHAITATALLFAALTSACAPSASGVEPASMAGAYNTLPCSKVVPMLMENRSEVDALSQKQNGAATQDAFSVFLIGVPTSGLSKNNVQGELAAAKGRVLALEARLASCQ